MRAMNPTWLTSFGDLLTLLLCFILVVMAHSSDARIQKSQNFQQDNLKNELLSQADETVGKGLASKPMSEYRHQTLSFVKADFDEVDKTLNSQGLSKLAGLKPEGLQKIELQVCNFSQKAVENLFKQIVAADWKLVSGQEACSQTGVEESIQLIAWFR